MPSDWKQFLGDVPGNAQWTMLVYGPSFGGKSTFSLIFANMLARTGDVLYINSEESLKGGTLQDKLRRLKVSSQNIFFLDTNNYEDYVNELKTGKYKYVFYDSISKFAKSTGRKILEIYNEHKDYPNVSFVYILFSTKDGKNFKGDADLKFLSEITIRVENLVADCSEKNRYKSNRNHFQFNFLKK